MATAAARWDELDGVAVRAGFDPWKLPADRFLNWVWFEVTEGMSPGQKDLLRARLELPLPGLEPDDEEGAWSDDEMGGAFLAAMGNNRLGG